MAFVLAPEPPIANWLAELENWTRSTPGFFVGRLDGYYRIAEDMDDNLRSRPVQAWLDVGGLMIGALG
jgi:hypothetical protein